MKCSFCGLIVDCSSESGMQAYWGHLQAQHNICFNSAPVQYSMAQDTSENRISELYDGCSTSTHSAEANRRKTIKEEPITKPEGTNGVAIKEEIEAHDDVEHIMTEVDINFFRDDSLGENFFLRPGYPSSIPAELQPFLGQQQQQFQHPITHLQQFPRVAAEAHFLASDPAPARLGKQGGAAAADKEARARFDELTLKYVCRVERSGSKIWICSECNISFQSPFNVQRHAEYTHNSKDPDRY